MTNSGKSRDHVVLPMRPGAVQNERPGFGYLENFLGRVENDYLAWALVLVATGVDALVHPRDMWRLGRDVLRFFGGEE